MRKFALAIAVLACSGLGLLAMPASAAVNVDWGVTISSGTPPPPVRYEPMPPPRPEFVWAAGFWRWRDGAYVWIPGRWERARVGYEYAQPEWREGPGGWNFQPGGWRRGSSHNEKRGREHENDHEREGHRGHDEPGSDRCPPGHRRKGDC